MGVIASQITSLTIVYSTVYSDADQRKHQSSASLAFVRGIHRRPVYSPQKWPVTRKMFPFDGAIMWWWSSKTVKPIHNGRHFADSIFNFFNENCCIRIQMNLFPMVQLAMGQRWFSYWLGAERQDIIRTSDDPVKRRRNASLGLKGLNKLKLNNEAWRCFIYLNYALMIWNYPNLPCQIGITITITGIYLSMYSFQWLLQPYEMYDVLSVVYFYGQNSCNPLHCRHNDHDGVSNHQPRGCLLNRLFRRRSKKTSKLRVTGLCAGNSPGPVNSPHKGPVTRKMFPFDDVIMSYPRNFTGM